VAATADIAEPRPGGRLIVSQTEAEALLIVAERRPDGSVVLAPDITGFRWKSCGLSGGEWTPLLMYLEPME
jgi:hypothetical protein